MKKILFAALSLSLCVAAAAVSSGAPGADGHSLKKLWSDYENAAKADRPLKEAEILADIRDRAADMHLPWDFYDAGRKYVYAVQRRNWKARDSVRTDFAARVKAFAEPIVTLAWMKEMNGSPADECLAFASADSARLSAVRHEDFYSDMNGQMGGALVSYIANDYEYELWSLYLNGGNAYDALKAHVGDGYPCAAWLAYCVAGRLQGDKRHAAMDSLATEYGGTAVGFYLRQEVLRHIFFDKLNRKGAGSADYRAFLDACRKFEDERGRLSGVEARMAAGCTGVAELIRTLTGESLNIVVEDGCMKILFRNLDRAKVSIGPADGSGGKLFFEGEAVNEKRSFYAIDTVSMPLPALNDGEYLIRADAKDVGTACNYRQYTISLAGRRDGRGYSIFAADAESGEPLSSANIKIFKGNDKLLEYKDFRLSDIFTPLPAEALSVLSDGGTHYIEASFENGVLRKSLPVPVRMSELSYDGGENAASERYCCNIYRDCGAYSPGDTVRFKTVSYKVLPYGNAEVCAGDKLSAEQHDSENNVLGRIDLTAGPLGGAAGEFVLPYGLRNGMFSISVLRGDGNTACTSYFRVDEFVLPTFELTFDDDGKAWFKGDDITVRGRMSSYSGHGLYSAAAGYRVARYGTVVAEGSAETMSDGSFGLSFKAEEEGWYDVKVTVTDGTGETHEYRRAVYAGDRTYVSAELKNPAEGLLELIEGEDRKHMYGYILGTDTAVFVLSVRNASGQEVPAGIEYIVNDENGGCVTRGTVAGGKDLYVDMSAAPSGLYSIKAASGDAAETELVFLKAGPEDESLDAPVKRLFMPGRSEVADGEDIVLRIGTADGPVWAVAEVFGTSSELLDARPVFLGGERGKKGSSADVKFTYRDDYPDAVRVSVFYFKDGMQYCYGHDYRRRTESLSVPFEFTSFDDMILPAHDYTFSFRTLPDAECLVAIFDRSMDAIALNEWQEVRLPSPVPPYISFDVRCGASGCFFPARRFSSKSMSGAADAAVVTDMMSVKEAAEEEAVFNDALYAAGAPPAAEDVAVRKYFAGALAFMPFLHSDADGDVSFTFRTSDKLSSYYVAVYVHTMDMHNGAFRRVTTVSLPLKVSVAEPRFLYAGDEYEPAVTVSAGRDDDIEGELYLYTQQETMKKAVSVSGGGAAERFRITVPENCDTLSVKAVFVPRDGTPAEYSDAMSVDVPVYRAEQTLTEAHSAVLPHGGDVAAVLEELKGRFVNIDGNDAVYSKTLMMDLIAKSMSSDAGPSCGDVLSLSEAFYVRKAADLSGIAGPAAVDAGELLDRILACRNSDGGFGWFEGMKSSPVITAVLLERFGKLAAAGAEVPDMDASVKYIDDEIFSTRRPSLYGGISLAQYLYVRSMYPEVPFTVSGKPDKKAMKRFGKEVSSILVPSAKEGRGLQGRILAKARRTAALRNLSSSADGIALARAWGLGGSALKKMRKSVAADIVSLLEYAVEHHDGGWYYPDAAMPFGGLLESEAYAHSLLCDLLSAAAGDDPDSETGRKAFTVAEGIRLWLMLQNETQRWTVSPAFVDALNSVLGASDELKKAVVVTGVGTFSKPFRDVEASGNGFSVERKLFRGSGSDAREIMPGDSLKVGERITAEYRIWSRENRSFVRLTAPREAMFSPAVQLSGYYGWPFSPLKTQGFRAVPQGYRNVRSDRTEFYFDCYPEERSVIREDFFVTQAGVFSAPVPEIETLYAPHYRANSGWEGKHASSYAK